MAHDFSIPGKNAETHWMECECGERSEQQKHVYENDCTANCSGCDYTRDGVGHNYTILCSDAKTHWKECECGAKQSPDKHIWKDSEGGQQICSYCKWENVGEQTDDSLVDSDVPSDSVSSGETTDDNNMLIVIVAAVAAVLLLGGIIIVVVKKKHK